MSGRCSYSSIAAISQHFINLGGFCFNIERGHALYRSEYVLYLLLAYMELSDLATDPFSWRLENQCSYRTIPIHSHRL